MSKVSGGVGRRANRLLPTVGAAIAKKPDTKQLLMETAEKLFGRHGLDGISLREIAIAAGQSNSNVVQYHFSDKAGLIAAILEYRVRQLETLRREMLKNLPSNEPQRTRELLKIMWLPATTLVDADGAHTNCFFLLQYLIHPHNVQHPLSQIYEVQNNSGEENDFAALTSATRLLRERFSDLPVAILNRRMMTLSMMFLAAVVEHDNSQLAENSIRQAFDAEPILDMAFAALSAPA